MALAPDPSRNPRGDRCHPGAVCAANGQPRATGRDQLHQGLLSGAGDRCARPVSWRGQAPAVPPARARTRQPAAGQPVFQPGESAACGTVLDAAPAPGGGFDLLAVLSTSAAEARRSAPRRPGWSCRCSCAPSLLRLLSRRSPAAGEARVRVDKLFDRLQQRCGVRGRLLTKRDEPNLWMEVYEGVADGGPIRVCFAWPRRRRWTSRPCCCRGTAAISSASRNSSSMCLIVVGWKLREDYPLMLAANRDEFFARPAAPAAFLGRPRRDPGRTRSAARRHLAGSDSLRAARRGDQLPRRAARARPAGSRAGGWCATTCCRSRNQPGFLAQVRATADQYDGFNLIAGTQRGLFHYSNRGTEVTALPAGCTRAVQPSPEHGLAQGASGPAKGSARLWTARPHALPEALFALLAERTSAPDEALPDTGIGLEWERLLSTAFIRSPTTGRAARRSCWWIATGRAASRSAASLADGTIVAHRRHDLQLSEVGSRR